MVEIAGEINCLESCGGCFPLDNPDFTGDVINIRQHGSNVIGEVAMRSGRNEEFYLATEGDITDPELFAKINARVVACTGMSRRKLGYACGAGIVGPLKEPQKTLYG